MKKILAVFLVFVLLLAGCQKAEETPVIEGTKINLSDKEITVDGNAVTTDSSQAVYTANDIVFYLAFRFISQFLYFFGTLHTDEVKCRSENSLRCRSQCYTVFTDFFILTVQNFALVIEEVEVCRKVKYIPCNYARLILCER